MVGAPFEDSSTATASVETGPPDPSVFDDAASNSGAVYTYIRLFGFLPSAYLKPEVRQPSARFGWSLAASNGLLSLLVGAPGESSAATGQNGDQASTASAGAGAAYEFLSIGTHAWFQLRYLKASNTESATISTGDAFGTAVAYDEGSFTIAVSASEEASGSFDPDDNTTPGAGAVYVY